MRLLFLDQALINRFEDKFIPEPNSGCWLWIASRDRQGYGRFSLSRYLTASRQQQAHRVSYLIYRGELTPDLVIDHLCRNTSCVNPDHLELVTRKVNTLRGNSPSAQCSRRTHCAQGHPFDARYSNGSRACRECWRATQRRAREPWRSVG